MKDAARVLARILSLACHLRVTFLATCMNGVSLACNGGMFICVACPKKQYFPKKTRYFCRSPACHFCLTCASLRAVACHLRAAWHLHVTTRPTRTRSIKAGPKTARVTGSTVRRDTFYLLFSSPNSSRSNIIGDNTDTVHPSPVRWDKSSEFGMAILDKCLVLTCGKPLPNNGCCALIYKKGCWICACCG